MTAVREDIDGPSISVRIDAQEFAPVSSFPYKSPQISSSEASETMTDTSIHADTQSSKALGN